MFTSITSVNTQTHTHTHIQTHTNIFRQLHNQYIYMHIVVTYITT